MNAGDQTLQVNQILDGRYRIVADRVAQDIGLAYNAYDMQHDRLVVVLFPQSPDREPIPLEAIKESQQAVVDLAQPDLIPYDRGGISQGQPYLVRQHVEGQTLGDLLRHAGRLGHIAATDIAIQLCDVLSPAHRAGLVHGGLSPQSVLIGDDGRVMLADTGLVPALRPSSTSPGRPWGRFPYLSPEQAAGDEILPSSDVYVIGLLLYEMLAGRPPFNSADKATLALQHLRQTPAPLHSIAPRIPPILTQIVHKSLAKEPSARYRNAGQVASILRSQIPPSPVQHQLVASDLKETAALQPGLSEELLLVPPPLAGPTGQSSHYQGQTVLWVDEPARVDWLMMALILVALISVLGLIPLWRSVYRHYTAPPPVGPSSSYFLPGTLQQKGQLFTAHRQGYDAKMMRKGAFHRSEMGLASPISARRQYFSYGRLSRTVGLSRDEHRPFHHGQDPGFGSLDYGFTGTM